MSENWGSIADMVSPPNHCLLYRDVGHGRQLWVMLFGRSPRQDGNKPFWGERLEVIAVNPAQRNACPCTSNLRVRLWCQLHCQGDITGPIWLRQALIYSGCAAKLGSADRLQFGHGLAQLLDHQAGKSLESPAGADNELKRNGMLGELRQYQVADFARAHLVVDVDWVQEGDCVAVPRDLFQEFD